jgi:hypothetical protein
MQKRVFTNTRSKENGMKFYVASSVKNKKHVQSVYERLKDAGHEVTVNWTLTEDIPEDERDKSNEYVRSIAKRDFEGIRDCDVFVLVSSPPKGRSMYVELGVALSFRDMTGRPIVYVIGPANNESVFYYHPLVKRVENWDKIIEESKALRVIGAPSKGYEGRLEEYRALRAEMLEIIKERVWGQATFAVLSAGTLTLMSDSGREPVLLFTMVLAFPFLFHTMQREHARIRMGNYLRVVLEPNLPGMDWEEYLGLWRGRFGRSERRGWLNQVDRIKHIFSFAGLYLLVSGFCYLYLYNITRELVPRASAGMLLCLLLLVYVRFGRLYDQGQSEYNELQRLGPKT